MVGLVPLCRQTHDFATRSHLTTRSSIHNLVIIEISASVALIFLGLSSSSEEFFVGVLGRMALMTSAALSCCVARRAFLVAFLEPIAETVSPFGLFDPDDIVESHIAPNNAPLLGPGIT